ncbi:DEAD/DEAH box helicase [Cognataquiflexum rubidum]|uniref:DEAD/DEAH box helicase n=1 Tax=Cognataquiflexum rubidum TaxID=2922273 RepID=UPI001F1368D4|nr:DEAD/DEAH box helicase [Cognataquiflexum rubidum]MCH6236658.1 DEAD/DEAH box helicase [Cognataquiflexum rubidum]
MQAFEVHKKIVKDYKDYLKSFNIIKDPKISKVVDEAFKKDEYIPEPLIQFNPSFKKASELDSLVKEGVLHSDMNRVFKGYRLFTHQEEAIRLGTAGKSFIVTSGTGSGKSVTFLGTIFNHLFSTEKKAGIKAILVYPMNALINSQEKEIIKFAANYGPDFPITFKKYTGQESEELRQEVESNPPDILLTNYMMLELLLTRGKEKSIRDSISRNLKYLVFDELHTYRGRQGADVSMLVRRLKSLCRNEILSIGTSATMASGEDVKDEKLVVAEVATQIFGEKFERNQIVGETLETVTIVPVKPLSAFDLQEVMTREIDLESHEEDFKNHPVAIWLENNIALDRDKEGNIKRAKPQELQKIVKKLSEVSKIDDLEKCETYLKRFFEWSEKLNIKNASNKLSFLPFKIHQFISQTGNVYVTLDDRRRRNITLEDGRYIKENGDERFIFPVLFSRYSGHDFICVKRNFSESKFEPREPDDLPERITKDALKGSRKDGVSKKSLKEENFEAGYLVLPEGNEELWSEDMIDTLPETWWKEKKGQIVLDNFYEFRIPQKVFFNAEGKFSSNKEDGLNLHGWFIAAPLFYDPSCGVVYDPRTKENTKLMKVGNVGRSTATTIATFSILKSQFEQKIKTADQKLLSFTDNRQDASLQTGHFNDFLMIGRLRSAIYRAIKEADQNQLTIETISDRVFQTLGLKESDYAKFPGDPEWPDEDNEKALKDYLKVRILYDLRRGWRYNTPNLEQCALLDVSYHRLDEFCAKDSFFEKDFLLSVVSVSERQNILLHVLNYFRTAYAFNYYLLEDEKRTALEERLKQRLNPDKEWSLETDERLDIPPILVYQRVGKMRKGTYTESIGATSNLGKYIKRLFIKYEQEPIKGAVLNDYISGLCNTLKKGQFLAEIEIKGEKGSTLGYQLRVEKVIWKLGDLENVLTDEVRINTTNSDLKIRPNNYFKEFYQQDFRLFNKFFLASEHTGQVASMDRIAREEAFRNGEISALYCSPTMELGIDIANLNIVHMRNVPPNPANYAQRSGRAGRSGQTALVFTYCSSTSPHDRHYFRNSIDMVAGKVKAPRIDLLNEELISSHFNAFIFMNLGLTSINTSVKDFLDIEKRAELPVHRSLIDFIDDQKTNFRDSWIVGFKKVVKDKYPDLEGTDWFNEDWLLAKSNDFVGNLENSFNRWRTLFKTASNLIERASQVIKDPTYSSDSKEAREAKRMQSIGQRQRDLLLNTSKRDGTNESEFYVYRYLAAEGFLPGYNFTRLPVRAFIGKRSQDQGTFISRPRFIALREFGPGNLIYYNGGKYRITRMQLSDADAKTDIIKISTKTGFAWLGEESKTVNNDPITQESLKSQSNAMVYKNIMELVESDTWPQERISSEEEERMSSGYEIEQYFNYPKGIEHTRNAVLKVSGHPLMNIIYCPATRLIQINKKWRSSKEQEGEEAAGFTIGKVSGKWLKKSELQNDERESDPAMTVHLYTTDTADSLYLQPVKALDLDEDGVVSLTYALKRAIEQVFQIEESEVGVWFMGPEDSRNILIYEAAEGSLGILSQLTKNPERLREVFTEAYQLMHFDLNSKTDKAPEKPKASYDDLLSYYNQRYHDKLDRHKIKSALELLMVCDVDSTGSGNSGHVDRDSHYQELLERYDGNSTMEKKLIDYLYKNDLQLPDKAQANLSKILGLYVSADFVYLNPDKTIKTIIFCDGSVHDKNEVREDDNHKREILMERGIDVVSWHYTETLEALVKRRKDIFRKA